MTQHVNSEESWVTGTGRLVQGNPFTFTDEVYGKPGVKLPNNRVEYFIAVAFPKNQPQATGWDAFSAMLGQVAAKHKSAATLAAGGWAGFAWKFADGDDPANANKPGWAGCWVAKFKNGFQPTVLDENRMAITADQGLQCGHYVRVVCSVKCNESLPPQAGLYLNFNTVQRVGYGTPIISGPDHSAALGAAPVAQLAGMSAIPMAGAAPIAAPVAAVAPPVAGVPVAGMVPPPVAGVPAGVVPPAVTPPIVAAPPVAVAPPPVAPPVAVAPPPVAETPQSRMIDLTVTYDAYVAGGWTEELLIQHGKMRPATHPYAS